MGSIARWYEFAELFAFCELHASRLGLHPSRRFIGNLDSIGWPRYFDRHGFPIPTVDGVEPTLVWARMREQGDYSIVAVDQLPGGSRLSTVWLGLDHGMGTRPLIFETMRFSGESAELTFVGPGGVEHTGAYSPSMEFPDPFGEPGETCEQLRYTTEEEALAAHHEIVRRIVVREGH